MAVLWRANGPAGSGNGVTDLWGWSPGCPVVEVVGLRNLVGARCLKIEVVGQLAKSWRYSFLGRGAASVSTLNL